MSHYQTYPYYKDSGIEWIGEMPEHWLTPPIKYIVSTPITDGPHETPVFLDEGVPFISAEAVSGGEINFDKKRGFISYEVNETYSKKYSPQKYDIYMVKSGATTGITAIVETEELFNIWSPLAAIRCTKEVANPYFILNFMKSTSFQKAVEFGWSYGTQQNIGMGVIENLRVALPPLDEQNLIVKQIDTVVGRINSLIAKKTRFIELLKEKRQALITHAVTKGLNPDVPMKDSGIEWIGEVPEHWEVTRLKYVSELNPKKSSVDVEREDLCTFLPMEKLKTDSVVLDETRAIEEVYDGYSYFVNGDILIAKVTPCFENKNIAIANDLVNGVGFGSTEINAIRSNEKSYNRFLYYRLQEEQFRKIAINAMTGTGGLKRVPSEIFQNFKIALPSYDEQKQIGKQIDKETTRIDNLIAKTQNSIELLKERRSAFITAAVTGQIDLRGATHE